VCTDAGTRRPALWSTKSEAAAGALNEVLVGPVRDALEAPPHAASVKAKAAVTTAVSVAVPRRPVGLQRAVSEVWDADELLMGKRSARDGRGRIRAIPSWLPGLTFPGRAVQTGR
jgi:hypothetical protein